MAADPAEIARKRVVYTVPGMAEVEVRRDLVYREIAGPEPVRMTMDVYLPPRRVAGERAAGVLLIHGGPLPEPAYGKVKSMGVFVSYGELLAASGFVAVTFNHLHHGWHDLEESAEHVHAVIARLRTEAATLGLDAERLCLWAFSGGGPQLAPVLDAPPPGVRCLVAYYPILDLPGTGLPPPWLPAVPAALAERFSPAARLAGAPPAAGWPPVLVARAGRDLPWLRAGVDAFIQAALAAGVELELCNHAAGQHSFDILDDVPRSREIIARTIEFIRTHTAERGDGAGEAGGTAAEGAR